MNISRFFSPQSIAVVGVSRTPGKIGRIIYDNLASQFRGRVYGVRRDGGVVHGKALASSVVDLPRSVDVAVIATPADIVCDVVSACADRGIRHLVIISSGFREVGGEGVERENKLISIIQERRLLVLGPNCLGYAVGDLHLNASFGQALDPGGNVALLSQSGAIAAASCDWATLQGMKFRSVVSMGNKAGCDECDCMEYFRDDKKTKVIMLYLESMLRGERFMRLLLETTRKKPVIILRAGNSELGGRAAMSHTGALTASSTVFRAAMLHGGAVVAETMQEFLNSALICSRTPTLRSSRVAIITNAGGPGILATDALSTTGLTLAVPTKKTLHVLRSVLPSTTSLANPFDLIGDADPHRYRVAMRALARDPSVDILFIILTPQLMTACEAVAHELVALKRQHPRVVLVASFIGGKKVLRARNVLTRAGIPHFHFPENGIQALATRSVVQPTARMGALKQLPALPTPLARAISRRVGRTSIVLPPISHSILRQAGFTIIEERFTKKSEDLQRQARALGYPVVLKLISHRAVHKAAQQAVWANISNSVEFHAVERQALRQFPNRFRQEEDEGWLLQRFLHHDIEVFLGARRDPAFGLVLLVGKGGVRVEHERHIEILFPPFRRRDLLQTIRSSPALVETFHSQTALRRHATAIASELERLAVLMTSVPTLGEVDMNPLLFRGDKPVVVDARLYMKK